MVRLSAAWPLWTLVVLLGEHLAAGSGTDTSPSDDGWSSPDPATDATTAEDAAVASVAGSADDSLGELGHDFALEGPSDPLGGTGTRTTSNTSRPRGRGLFSRARHNEMRTSELGQWLRHRGWLPRSEQPDGSHSVWEKTYPDIEWRAVLVVAAHGQGKLLKYKQAHAQGDAIAADVRAAMIRQERSRGNGRGGADQGEQENSGGLGKFDRRAGLQAEKRVSELLQRRAAEQAGRGLGDHMRTVEAVNAEAARRTTHEKARRTQNVARLEMYLANTRKLLSFGRPDLAVLHLRGVFAPRSDDSEDKAIAKQNAEAARYWTPDLLLDAVLLLLLSLRELVAGGETSSKMRARVVDALRTVEDTTADRAAALRRAEAKEEMQKKKQAASIQDEVEKMWKRGRSDRRRDTNFEKGVRRACALDLVQQKERIKTETRDEAAVLERQKLAKAGALREAVAETHFVLELLQAAEEEEQTIVEEGGRVLAAGHSQEVDQEEVDQESEEEVDHSPRDAAEDCLFPHETIPRQEHDALTATLPTTNQQDDDLQLALPDPVPQELHGQPANTRRTNVFETNIFQPKNESSGEKKRRKDRVRLFESQVHHTPAQLEALLVHALAILESARGFLEGCNFHQQDPTKGRDVVERARRAALDRLTHLRRYFLGAVAIHEFQFILDCRRLENWGSMGDYDVEPDPHANEARKGWVYRRKFLLRSAEQRLGFLLLVLGGNGGDSTSAADSETKRPNPYPLKTVLENSPLLREGGICSKRVEQINGEMNSFIAAWMGALEQQGRGLLNNTDERMQPANVTNVMFSEHLIKEETEFGRVEICKGSKTQLEDGGFVMLAPVAEAALAWRAYREVLINSRTTFQKVAGLVRREEWGEDWLSNSVRLPAGPLVLDQLPFFVEKLPHFAALAKHLRKFTPNARLDRDFDVYEAISPLPTLFDTNELRKKRLGRKFDGSLHDAIRHALSSPNLPRSFDGTPLPTADADSAAFGKIYRLMLGSDEYFWRRYLEVQDQQHPSAVAPQCAALVRNVFGRKEFGTKEDSLFTFEKRELLRGISHHLGTSVLEPFFSLVTFVSPVEESRGLVMPVWNVAASAVQFASATRAMLAAEASVGAAEWREIVRRDENHKQLMMSAVSRYAVLEIMRHCQGAVRRFAALVRDLRIGFLYNVELTYRGNPQEGARPLSKFFQRFRDVLNAGDAAGHKNLEMLSFLPLLEQLAWGLTRLALVWESVRLHFHLAGWPIDAETFFDNELMFRGAVVSAVEGLQMIRHMFDVFQQDLQQPRLVSAYLSPCYMAVNSLQFHRSRARYLEAMPLLGSDNLEVLASGHPNHPLALDSYDELLRGGPETDDRSRWSSPWTEKLYGGAETDRFFDEEAWTKLRPAQEFWYLGRWREAKSEEVPGVARSGRDFMMGAVEREFHDLDLTGGEGRRGPEPVAPREWYGESIILASALPEVLKIQEWSSERRQQWKNAFGGEDLPVKLISPPVSGQGDEWEVQLVVTSLPPKSANLKRFLLENREWFPIPIMVKEGVPGKRVSVRHLAAPSLPLSHSARSPLDRLGAMSPAVVEVQRFVRNFLLCATSLLLMFLPEEKIGDLVPRLRELRRKEPTVMWFAEDAGDTTAGVEYADTALIEFVRTMIVQLSRQKWRTGGDERTKPRHWWITDVTRGSKISDAFRKTVWPAIFGATTKPKTASSPEDRSSEDDPAEEDHDQSPEDESGSERAPPSPTSSSSPRPPVPDEEEDSLLAVYTATLDAILQESSADEPLHYENVDLVLADRAYRALTRAHQAATQLLLVTAVCAKLRIRTPLLENPMGKSVGEAREVDGRDVAAAKNKFFDTGLMFFSDAESFEQRLDSDDSYRELTGVRKQEEQTFLFGTGTQKVMWGQRPTTRRGAVDRKKGSSKKGGPATEGADEKAVPTVYVDAANAREYFGLDLGESFQQALSAWRRDEREV